MRAGSQTKRGCIVTVVPAPSVDPELGVDALYRRHGSEVYRFLLRELGNRQDAEDATQTVFVSAFRSIARGRPPRSPRPWLFAIARNAARSAWRERSRQGATDVDPDTLAVADEADTARQELVGALETLPETQRRALVLHELGGLDYVEIAHETKQTVAGVETAIFRARRACRAQLRAGGALDHEAAAKLLTRFVAGKLTRVERVSLEAHLRDCSACADEERALRAARPRRTRRLLTWLFSLPDGLQRLSGILQAPSPRALAVLAVAGAAVAGGGGGGPAAEGNGGAAKAGYPATRIASSPTAPAVRHSSRTRPAAHAELAGAAVRLVRGPTAHGDGPARARSVPRTRTAPPAPAPRASVTRPRHVAAPVSGPSSGTVHRPRVDAAPTPTRPLAQSLEGTVGVVTGSLPETTSKVAATVGGVEAGVEQVADDLAAEVDTLTGVTPGASPALPVPAPLETPVAELGGAAAETLSAVALPRLDPPTQP